METDMQRELRTDRENRMGITAVRIILWVLGLFLVVGLADIVLPAQPASISFQSGVPNPVVNVGASYSGQGGSQAIYYWVIARFPAGSGQPSAVAVALNTQGSQNLSASNTVTITWTGITGATGYDVVRSDTAGFPATPCACAVILNTANLSALDTGSVLSTYPPAGVPTIQPVLATLSVDNVSQSVPYINVQLVNSSLRMALSPKSWTAGNCVQIGTDGNLADSGAVCSGGGSGDVVGPGSSTNSNFALFSGTTGKILKDIGYAAHGNGLGVQMFTGSAPSAGDCAEFDAAGNVVGAGGPCSGGSGNVTAGGTLTANEPVIGAGGTAIAVGTRSGNTTQMVTTTGTQTSGRCVTIDADGNHIQAAGPCGSGNVTTQVTLTQNMPVLGNNGVDTIVGTKSGNTNQVVTTTGSQTNGRCVQIDVDGNHIAASGACAGPVTLTPPYFTTDSGTTYYGPIFQLFRPADYGSFTWQNQGGATVTTTNGAFYFDFPQAPATADVRSYVASLPGGTSWIATGMFTTTGSATNNQYCGIGLRESGTSKIVMLGGRAQTNIRVSNYTNDTTLTSAPYDLSWQSVNNIPVWFQITRAGATLSYAIGASPSGMKTVYSAATTVFFTAAPDQIGISCDVNNGNNGNVLMSLQSLIVQ